MKQSAVRKLQPGIYRLWWANNVMSTAAVGVSSDGGRWMAPLDWKQPPWPTEKSHWSGIVRTELLMSVPDCNQAHALEARP